MTQSRIEAAELLDEIVAIDLRALELTREQLRLIQSDYFEVIRSYARADGTINPSRINALFRDLQSLEGRYGASLEESIEQGLSEVTVAVISFLMINQSIGGMSDMMDLQGYMNSRNIDGLNLRDRSRIMSGDLTDATRRRLRRSIYQDATSGDLMDGVMGAFEEEDWKVERLVTAELNNGYRQQFGDLARAEGHEYIQFYESEWCTSRNHHNHRCHILAHEDRYGLGEGVFKVTDLEIYHPHPRCRGYFGLYEGGS